MRRIFFILTLMACCLPAAVFARKSTYIFTSFDFPGATWTYGDGVNHAGTITGSFLDATFAPHGYIWSAGTFTQLDSFGVPAQDPQAIDDAGDVVGWCGPPMNSSGFILSGGKFSYINFPNADWTKAYGINNSGMVVGTYYSGVLSGFLLNGGKFTWINYPKALLTDARGINDNGKIVGLYMDAAGNTHGFLWDGKKFSSIDYPGATETRAFGINLAGDIVGEYRSSDGTLHGFMLPNGNRYTSIDYPSAKGTSASGINDLGEIVGSWYDGGNMHGFYAVKQ
jgi:probable HAF family extracellular repeat protein